MENLFLLVKNNYHGFKLDTSLTMKELDAFGFQLYNFFFFFPCSIVKAKYHTGNAIVLWIRSCTFVLPLCK